MTLRVVGAGLPRTGTTSLALALERLLGRPCHHMQEIPGHPFDLGAEWQRALSGQLPDWERIYAGYVAAVDWPTSAFWAEVGAAFPDALVLLSTRDSARTWWKSMDATVLAAARAWVPPTAGQVSDLGRLIERVAGTADWDDADTLMAGYEQHVDRVRAAVPADRLVEWRPGDGWPPLCRALGVDEPAEPFPWRNRRGDWS
jgi:Sulfotransferase domain